MAKRGDRRGGGWVGSALSRGTAIYSFTYSYFKKGCHSQELKLEPKGTLGTLILSDVAFVKVVIIV